MSNAAENRALAGKVLAIVEGLEDVLSADDRDAVRRAALLLTKPQELYCPNCYCSCCQNRTREDNKRDASKNENN